MECALWFYRNGHIDWELHDDEAGALEMAAWYEDGDNDDVVDVLGVQFADGRTIKAAEWAGLPEARQRERERRRRVSEAYREPRPMRKARDPFTGATLMIHESDPPWAGVAP